MSREVETNRVGEVDRLVIRTATVDDATLLARLGARLFEQTFAADNTPDDMRMFLASTFSSARQRDELADPDRASWLATLDGGNPVGFATIRRGVGGDGVVGSVPVELQRIYVDGSVHGHGVGRRLMQACVEQAVAWGADVLWLGVWEQNARAISFYERGGFRVVGSHAFTVGTDPQRDIVMARPLD